MEFKKKVDRIAELTKELWEWEEKVSRIKKLNRFDHTEDRGTASSRFHVKFGGGDTHTSLYLYDNEMGDKIEAFFADLFGKRMDACETELKSLITPSKEI